MNTGKAKVRSKRRVAICVPALVTSILWLAVCGCGPSAVSEPNLSAASKGYVVYVFARRTAVMIDLCKSDGLASGTELDVFRTNLSGLDKRVKIGEITVKEVGPDMSKARVTAVTSSLRMERGDTVLARPIVIVSDTSWVSSTKPLDGWKSEISLSDERDWRQCEAPQRGRVGMSPEIRQLVADTGVQPIWHTSVKSSRGDVFFRKVFRIDAEPVTARMSILCGGKANIYLNDRWVGEASAWPEISSFKVDALVDRGANLIAVHAARGPRSIAPPVLFLALNVQTKFQ